MLRWRFTIKLRSEGLSRYSQTLTRELSSGKRVSSRRESLTSDSNRPHGVGARELLHIETTKSFSPLEESGQGGRTFQESDVVGACVYKGSESSCFETVKLGNSVRTAQPLPSWDRGGRNGKNSLPPMYLAIRAYMDKYSGCVCVVQVGSFYEIYFEQAENFGPLLGIKVTQKRTTNYSIPMCGFPTYQLKKFVKMLVHDQGALVAIIDQYMEGENTVIHRKVSRIVSPGTLIDELFVNYARNNYLLAISFPPNLETKVADPLISVGLAWLDLLVGEFFVQETTLHDVIGDIVRISPSEIVLTTPAATLVKWWAPLTILGRYFTRLHSPIYRDLKLNFVHNQQRVRKRMELFSVRELAAMHLVLSYVNVNLPEAVLDLDVPKQFLSGKYLHMDSRTRDALELVHRQNGGKGLVVGLLFSVLKHTITTLGTRMLSQWLNSPLLDVEEIQRRQWFCGMFLRQPELRRLVRVQLSTIEDVVRAIQRLAIGFTPSSGPATLLGIAETIDKFQMLRNTLKSKDAGMNLLKLIDEFQPPIHVADEIKNTLRRDLSLKIDDETSFAASEEEVGECDFEVSLLYKNTDVQKYQIESDQSREFEFSVRPDYNEKLIYLHRELHNLIQKQTDTLVELQKKLRVVDPKVTVVKKSVHGRHQDIIYISSRMKYVTILEEYIESVREKRKLSLICKPPDWSHLQDDIMNVVTSIANEENSIIAHLCSMVSDNTQSIRELARVADFIDVTSSLAKLAHEQHLVCPKFTKTNQLSVRDGRHLVVENGLQHTGKQFFANDTQLNGSSLIWVVTGPNMGGKSTFLRQNAVIVILAQIGSFVPASKATLLVVDRIFTRIGASDDLYSDLSTFMVEMVETASILNHATSRSLAIVDEIGRGTSGKEGLAIAYATLVHLLQVTKCRTLFATHYGRELALILDKHDVNRQKIAFRRTRMVSGQVTDYQLQPGISERSYALEVARAAGFPEKTLDLAQKVLDDL